MSKTGRDRRDEGIGAVNQEFRRYEQVRKDQTYHLTENPAAEQFDEEFRIRTCDMGPFFDGGAAGRERFAADLGAALESIGFAILTGHGVDPALYRDGAAKIRELFETTTRSQRDRFLAKRHGSVNQGYFPLKETTIIHPDLVEGWVFCRRAFDLDERAGYREEEFWPAPGFEPVFRRICLAHEALVLPVMQSILLYLGCDPHLYDRRLTGANFGFRVNYYPPLDDAGRAAGGGRMLGHEDVDLFTFLPAPEEEGLQVLNRANMRWIRLDAPPGAIILNTGDYMQRITNDRLPSTTHRVARPRTTGPDASTAGTPPGVLHPGSRPRVSFPMAIYVWEDEILEVLPGLGAPRYEPVRAEQFHTRITSKYYGDDYAAG